MTVSKPTHKTLRTQAARLRLALERAHGRCVDGGDAAHRDVRAFYARAYTKAEAELNAAPWEKQHSAVGSVKQGESRTIAMSWRGMCADPVAYSASMHRLISQLTAASRGSAMACRLRGAGED